MANQADSEPDTKDWTWVIENPCRACGFDPATVRRNQLTELIHDNTRNWCASLDRPDPARRPGPGVWSRLEYAGQVRDVHRCFQGRLQLMLDQDSSVFANWDQDATAVQERYAEQDPVEVVVGRYHLHDVTHHLHDVGHDIGMA